MSDADRFTLAEVAESTFGVTPSGPPTLQDIRFTGVSLKETPTVLASTEIREDGQVADVSRGAVQVEGDLNYELSYGSYDNYFKNVLRSAGWSTAQSVGPATNLSVTAGSGNYTITAATGTPFSAFAADQWVKISGFANAANNGYGKIVSVGGGGANIVVEANGNGSTESAGASVTIKMGAQIVNGTSFESRVIEGQHTDLASSFVVWNGITFARWALSIVAQQIITGSFGLVGTRESSGTATIGDGANTAANTNEVMTATEDVLKLLEGATYANEYTFNSLNFSVENNIRARPAAANVAPISFGRGKFNVSGGLELYLEDAVLANKFLAFTKTAFAIILEDSAGNGYVMEWPEVVITNAPRVPAGTNQDIMLSIEWMAQRDSTENVTMRIARFPAA